MGLLDTGWQVVWFRMEQSVMHWEVGTRDILDLMGVTEHQLNSIGPRGPKDNGDEMNCLGPRGLKNHARRAQEELPRTWEQCSNSLRTSCSLLEG